jgi:hypothetical protein
MWDQSGADACPTGPAARYNITTSDFPAWPSDAMEATHPWKDKMVDYRNNSRSEGDPRTPVQQNPYVFIGAGDSANTGSQFVTVRANTNQYGRTFQDRSYKFAIKKRPTAAAAANDNADTPYVPVLKATDVVINVNVRGKRGNIVQTYPSVEYDFVPNRLSLEPGNYLHFQWTGSDYNPRRGCNDGNGGPPDPNDFISAANANDNSRADRSNLVWVDGLAKTIPSNYMGIAQADIAGTNYATQELESANATLLKSPCYSASRPVCVWG